MTSLLRGTASFLTWVAVLWTIYEEQRHLALYLGDPEIAFGIGEYIDIVVTVLLLGYAVYEVLHFAGTTRGLDRTMSAHPAIDTLTVVFIAALAWGIYRDLGHFHHIYVGAESGVRGFNDGFDEAAAVLLVLAVIKTGYHTLHALRALLRLCRSRGQA